jgi:uncharacterized protein YjbI with pentapeptide repeats
MFGLYVDSDTKMRRHFCLAIGSSFIAIAITLFVALRSRSLDYGLVTVGVAAIMTIYLAAGLDLVTSACLPSVWSGARRRCSGTDSPLDDLWDDELDGIISDATFPSVGPTEPRRRMIAAGSVRLACGLISWEHGSSRRADYGKFLELVGKLRGINLQGTDPAVVDLGGTDMSGADLSGADLGKANLSGGKFRRADFRESSLRETILREADLTQADFREADLSLADFSSSTLREANLRWVDLSAADFTGADLFGANLERAILDKASFRGANLNMASFNVRNFDDVDLSGADLRETDIRGANLSRARGLTQAQVNAARGDASTILPRGLVRPWRWKMIIFGSR